VREAQLSDNFGECKKITDENTLDIDELRHKFNVLNEFARAGGSNAD